MSHFLNKENCYSPLKNYSESDARIKVEIELTVAAHRNTSLVGVGPVKGCDIAYPVFLARKSISYFGANENPFGHIKINPIQQI